MPSGINTLCHGFVSTARHLPPLPVQCAGQYVQLRQQARQHRPQRAALLRLQVQCLGAEPANLPLQPADIHLPPARCQGPRHVQHMADLVPQPKHPGGGMGWVEPAGLDLVLHALKLEAVGYQNLSRYVH